MTIENKYAVGGRDNSIFIGKAESTAIMTRRDALILAAWLVAMAETKTGEFQKILKEVENT